MTEAAEKVAKLLPIDCPICGKSQWVNVDEYRLKPGGMMMCETCAFITYPKAVEDDEQLKQFYRKEYRPGPSVQNVFTGQRKLHYHANFLDDLFREWKKAGRKPDVFEVGAAFGMFLKWVRDTLPGSKVSGSELTLSFRRVAYHEYGIRLGEDFDESKKYDLIASYKVLEHIPYPDKELRRYAMALKQDGLLYISVPTWFHTMTNFGLDGFSLDAYYDKNHVNVWTKNLFETLLKKCGLEVIKRDYVYYDSTYLCRRNDELMKDAPTYEAPEKIIEALDRIKKASLAFDVGDFDEALKQYPAYPEAHIGRYEKNRQAFHQRGFEFIEKNVMEPALKQCPNTHKITFLCADLCMRYDQIDKAMEFLKICNAQKPGDASSLIAVAHCYRALAGKASDPAEAAKFLEQARDVGRHVHQVSLQHSLDAVTWIFGDEAKMPMPGE